MRVNLFDAETRLSNPVTGASPATVEVVPSTLNAIYSALFRNRGKQCSINQNQEIP
jgi:hypothetical protein